MTTQPLPKSLREGFSKKLKLLRVQQGLSQTDIAGRMAAHRTMVSQIERGVLNFSLDTYEKALRACANADSSAEVRTIRLLVGNRLRAIREAKSMSQEGLGEMAGFSVAYIGRVERGVVSTSIDQLERLAEILQVNAEELIDEPSIAIATL